MRAGIQNVKRRSGSSQAVMEVLVYAMCLVVMGVYVDCGSPNLVLDFLSVFSGKWDNSAAVKAGLSNELYNDKFVPVDLPAFRNKTLVYFENALNGRVFSLFLCEVIQDKSSNNTVLLVPYGFINYSNYRAGQFDLDDLYDLTPDDLTSFKQCSGKFQTSGNGTFSGPCAECDIGMNQNTVVSCVGPGCVVLARHPSKRKILTTYSSAILDPLTAWSPILSATEPHPVCRLTFSCDTYTIDRPPYALEPGEVLQDVLLLNGPRYPLVNVPKGYVSPCAKRNRTSTKGKHTVKEDKKY